MKSHKYLLPITGLFTATLLISNTLESKVFALGPFDLTAGTLIFPLAYIFNDILTEVYGYAAARRVIWTGFASLLLMSAFYHIAIIVPPAAFWAHQDAFAQTLGSVPRIVAASMAAYLAGEFVNSYVLAKMKIASKGRHMGVRFAASTLAGQFFDTAIFTVLAFAGVYGMADLLMIGLSMWAAKVLWELAAMPITLYVVRRIKVAEQEDHYDTNTNFNPFTTETEIEA